MIGKLLAIMTSAVCAYAVVALVPGFVPPVAAHAAQKPAVEQAAIAQIPVMAAASGRPACMETWPYYEAACLHDARQPDGRARVVRVVSIERTAEFESRPR
jgi:hypothetical protein